jgi:hypothetical protein
MKTKLTILLILVLSGCNLAQPAPVNPTTQESPILVGIYVAMTVDLEDFTSIPEFDINDKEQTYFLIEEKNEGDQKYTHSIASGKFYQAHESINVSDTEEKVEFSAKLPGFNNQENYYHLFAIYKQPDGSYVQAASNTYQMKYGGGFKIEDSRSVTVDKVTKTKSISFDIQVETFDPLVSLRLIYLNDDYTLLDSLEVKEESTVVIDKNSAYIMIEEVRRKANDELVKTLTVVDRNIITDELPYTQTIITSNDHLLSPIMVLNLVNKAPVE